MPMTIPATLVDGSATAQVTIDGFPDTCPICHVAVVPKFLTACAKGLNPSQWLEAAFQCTSQSCQHIFIGTYDGPSRTSGEPSSLRKVAPFLFVQERFSAEISGVSRAFVEVYNQALAAESHGLTELTGIGLRKALEFLIKDFAISRNRAEEQAVKAMPLAACIKRFVTDPSVQRVAERAVWLGNDETHYLRKWEDHDVGDLKKLIRLAVNGLENVLLAEKYLLEMPEKPKGSATPGE